jgi:DNA-binding winged helix-turn-helix (wHTH) protein
MSTMPSKINRLYEFGPFRLDPQKRLLFRGKDPIALTPKAIETLVVLVENRERVLLKDDLMKMLWPDSFVEEANLSQNIFLLRKALGDSAQEKRYILTVPGRGYQFTETVHEVGKQEEKEEEALVVETHSRTQLILEQQLPPPSRPWPALAVFLLVVLATLVFFTYRANHHGGSAPGSGPLPQIRQLRLTANPADLPVTSAAISADGKYLARRAST